MMIWSLHLIEGKKLYMNATFCARCGWAFAELELSLPQACKALASPGITIQELLKQQGDEVRGIL